MRVSSRSLIDESCEWREFFASRRMRGMRGNFWGNTNLANGTNFLAHAEYAECAEIFWGTRISRMARKVFLVGLRFLWLLRNVWLMRGVWMWGLDSDFDAGEEAARKGGTVDVA